jgi:hypothetical protein
MAENETQTSIGDKPMKYTPLLGADMTGRLGAVIASKNRYGTYFREGSIPVNPQTDRQSVVRNAFQFLTNRWNATLSDAERAAWNNYAAAVPIIGVNGKSQKITGFTMFIRNNVAIFTATGSIFNPGPAILSLPETDPTVAITASAATQLISVSFNNALGWANEVGGHMFIHGGEPQLATRYFFKGPYRYAGKIDGAVSAPTSPKTFTAPFHISVGQKLFAQMRVSRADGRLSNFFQPNSVIVGA